MNLLLFLFCYFYIFKIIIVDYFSLVLIWFCYFIILYVAILVILLY